MGRANWAWMFREMQGLQIIRPEHLGAVRQWRALGLDKFATAVTPLGVAVLHNHEEIAKWLMGHDPTGEPKHMQVTDSVKRKEGSQRKDKSLQEST